MDRSRKLAHVVAYYLSRFDKSGLVALGFKTDREAFGKIADALHLLPNYIKFTRDEFDVAHPFKKGWHKRPMTSSVVNTINALHELDEPLLRGIVTDILSNGTDSSISENLDQLTRIFPNEKIKKRKNNTHPYVPRNITGRKAETEFINWYENNKHVFFENGRLNDCRDNGCGYDFEVSKTDGSKLFIEVKGISSEHGGIMFTNKEWETAQKLGVSYYLVIVSDLDNQPKLKVLNNPAQIFIPKRNITTVIQVNWSLTYKDHN